MVIILLFNDPWVIQVLQNLRSERIPEQVFYCQREHFS